MAKYFSPLLAKGSGAFGLPTDNPKMKHSAVLVNMSARVGSITDNGELFQVTFSFHLKLKTSAQVGVVMFAITLVIR